MEPLSPVEVDEDYTTVLIYQGKGYVVYENNDRALDSVWFTLVIDPKAADIAEAMRYFSADDADILDVEFDGRHVFLDVAYA